MSKQQGPRCAVFVGPFGAGKSTLVSGLVSRSENVTGNLDADVAPGARRYFRCEFLGERWTLIDCPGSVEFLQQSIDALAGADMAVVVVEAKSEAAVTAMPHLRVVAEAGLPVTLFLNKLDQSEESILDVVDTFRDVFPKPLFLRYLPFREDNRVAGSVDLISQRAFRYREGEASETGPVPESVQEDVAVARQTLLESLADFNDDLLEQLLEEEEPSDDSVFRIGQEAFAEGQFSPVLIGSAEHGNGVTRLFKSLRHDAPPASVTAARHGLEGEDGICATVIDTRHLPHVGRVNVLRVWNGELEGSAHVAGQRISSLVFFDGAGTVKAEKSGPGEVIALGRGESLVTGNIAASDAIRDGAVPEGWRRLTPVYSLALRVENRGDDVKLGTSLGRMVQEDASLTVGHAEEGGIILSGQGEMHIREMVRRLEEDQGLSIETGPVGANWRETITRPTDIHARHKKQTGGAGQFADVKVRIRPTSRGSGFRFASEISGGVVPRQYIPAVEAGLREALGRGPLGFLVEDVEATLYDGQYHSVDSSENAFKTAGRMAMSDALEQGGAVLLEPIHKVSFETPSSFSSKLNAVISSRRGQILGFDALDGVPGWDEVSAMLPEGALSDLILEVRALTQGVARFRHEFDHYQELRGRDAEMVVEARKQELSKS